ncbi:hypothetical protein ACAG39_12420, partial [Caldicellulosiruptoraceae bacterium PP1]
EIGIYKYDIFNNGYRIGEQLIEIKKNNEMTFLFKSNIKTFYGNEETSIIFMENNYEPLIIHNVKTNGSDKEIIDVSYMYPNKFCIRNGSKERILWFTGRLYNKLQILFLLHNLYKVSKPFNMKCLNIFIPEALNIIPIAVKSSNSSNKKFIYYLWQPHYTVSEYDENDHLLLYYNDNKTIIERVY